MHQQVFGFVLFQNSFYILRNSSTIANRSTNYSKTYFAYIMMPVWKRLFRFDHHFAFLNISVQSSVSQRLIAAAFQTNANILKTDNSKIWKYYRTKEFSEICDSQHLIEQTAIRFIKSDQKSKKNPPHLWDEIKMRMTRVRICLYL